MRISTISLALVFTVQSVHAQSGATRPAATCRQADELTAHVVRNYQNAVTSTDSFIVASRKRNQIPNVAASEVSYVTDNAICAKVEQAYSTALSGNGRTPSLQVYVLKVGDVYVIWDPAQRGGEFVIHGTVSATFKVLSTWSG